MSSSAGAKKKDVFAEIAAQRQSLQRQGLVEPLPPRLPETILPVRKVSGASLFKPQAKLDSAKKLEQELKRQRRVYSRYMRNLAPEQEVTRISVPLGEFDWRLQSGNRWKKVRIPHYGGPLGRAVSCYRTQFRVTKKMLAKGAVFVCFKGVDYKTHVFVNDEYVGSHEGFFAPFEFDITSVVQIGTNTLLVKVENDAICMGNDSWGDNGHKYEGDKIYAATGPGYDDPEIGWHHCPPGMGICQDVFVEARSSLHVHDIFVRPILEEERAETWIQVYNCSGFKQDISLEISVFGQNFRKTLFRNRKAAAAYAGPGINYYRIPFALPNPRIWTPDTPWLYQIQIRVLDKKGGKLDSAVRQFGMRSFRMEETHKPKGRFYLNGEEIRLRGANTMGHLQQCVMKKDWGQLRDDILLAKICNMNFLRLTQRPVQAEIYDFCDRLGLMLQTDLPLFGCLRRNQFCEAVKQAGEMERLVRSHPSSIMLTYINEPSMNAGNKLHRHLLRHELEAFFKAADEAVRLNNPDRVIKAVDGDYDPPGPGLPDNHCYSGWYNGHGVDIGKLHKGYWQRVKPGWYYGCGEFGSEGLDPVNVMRKYYPGEWLPQTKDEEKNWSPNEIVKSQTGRLHYMWFDTQNTLAGWVKASQAHQAWVTRLMTEAFRRDNRMVSCAIHLFIDAFPSGWMKAIMDVDRQPKPAYFAYREALSPLMVNLRTDRYAFFSNEEISLEAWVCNDLNHTPAKTVLLYQMEKGGNVLIAGKSSAGVPVCGSEFQGFLRLKAPVVARRSKVVVRLALSDSSSRIIHETALELDVFPTPGKIQNQQVFVIGSKHGKAACLVKELGARVISRGNIKHDGIILIDDYDAFRKQARDILSAVESGAKAIFLELASGTYKMGNSEVKIVPCGMGAHQFVSRNTGHSKVRGFKPDDFKFWYDCRAGYVTPFLKTTFSAGQWNPILLSGNGGWRGDWFPAMAAGECQFGKGCLRISQVELSGRIHGNPVTFLFAQRLLGF